MNKKVLACVVSAVVVTPVVAEIAPPAAHAIPSADLVISQVFGGGGNSGAPFRNDFIELFNRGTTSVSLNGMSVQYASATGTGNFGANPVTQLSGTLAPGQYYLVQEAAGTAGNGEALPPPDTTGGVSMSATDGKVALVTSTTGLACNGSTGQPCSAEQRALIKDLVGYGTANFSEGSPAPTLSNTTAALRLDNGCAETDNNAADFVAGAPSPRNTSSPTTTCGVVADLAPEVTGTFPANGATDFPVDGNLTVSFSESVNVTAPWFELTCSQTGAVEATVTGGASTFTLDPAPTLADGESCTLTVLADQVSDADGNDPPDSPEADFTVRFTAVDACAQTFTPIPNIQGSGPNAAITGTVTTEGLVVGDFEGTASQQGFYLQDPAGDGNPATSDGIFVFTGNADLVSEGQVVRVTGFARERFNQTTLNGSNSNTAAVPVANIVPCGSGSVAATDVVMPFADANAPERFEGMLVRFPQSLVIAEYFNYDRFGEIVLGLPLAGEPRPFTGTAIDEPGAAANARTLANSLRRITLDDAMSAQNPDRLRHPNGRPFTLDNRFRGGDTVRNAVGVLGFDFSLYRIFPTGPADYEATNPRPQAPEPVGGTLRVAAMNTLNYFLTLDYPTGDPRDNKCGPAQNVECRGADSDVPDDPSQPDELTRQRTKLLAALTGLDGDIIGLNELENTTGVEPLADIVAGLPGYDFVRTGTIGTDAIKVGLIYRPAKVRPIGAFQTLDSQDDPRFIDTKSRPALAQTFEEIATGSRFTVVVNHLKSKGSDCNDIGDPDLGDGQGNCSRTRAMAARALVDWLATDPTGSGDPDFLIMGDLNSYPQEDSIDAIKAGADDVAGTGDDFTNLIAQFHGPFAYSYTFDGQAGYLDHALAGDSLLGQVTGAADWHINSDEPDVIDYDVTFKRAGQEALYEPNAFRTSDHDPLVVGLDLVNAPPSADAGGPYQVIEGASVTLTATGVDPEGTAVTFEWDLDGDGGFETEGRSVSFSSAGITAPATRTVRVRVTDAFGNRAVDDTTVSVLYNFDGFFAPVHNLPTTNSVNAGQSVPVRFSLNGDHGLAIFAAGSPRIELVSCATSVTQSIERADGRLTYKSSSDEYTYTWKTDRAWAGQCGFLRVTFNDGTTQSARFRFTK
jgi:predicted extracellular nuclease